MPLKLHNTLTRSVELFEPLDPGRVTMYVCGPTVYNFVHIGNARPVVVFDVLYRLLLRQYPRVDYARNITDLDDKIYAAAKDNAEPIEALTDRFTRAFHEDMAALNTLPPTIEPRATAHIGAMIAMIEALLASGNAYEAEGHVLFHVPSMADYGGLSGRNREDMIAGARVDVAPYKRDPADFVLWKPSTDDLPGWDSPWGRGRPGWHLECSAMVETHLGVTVDIHGGGQDLIFPHHENELAQARCAHGGTPFARYWVHNGYVTMSGEKMAKSEGNFLLVRDLLGRYAGEAIRYALLSAQYRQPLDWSPESVEQAGAALDRLYNALLLSAGTPATDSGPPAALVAALEDDLNTPVALSVLHDTATALNRAREAGEGARVAALRGELVAGAGLLGLLDSDPKAWFRAGDDGLDEAEVDTLVAEREAARRARDFDRADAIREQLAQAGIMLEDGPQGTRWRRGTPHGNSQRNNQGNRS